MPAQSDYIACLLASALFILVPGPSVLFTVGRALTVGRGDALRSVLGNALGLLPQVTAVAAGLAALVTTSEVRFMAFKLIGAGYAVWLGLQAIRHRAASRLAILTGDSSREAGRAVQVGFVVGLSNPKTFVFFAAFLPQFVDPAHPAAPQLLLFGVSYVGLALASHTVWALTASQLRFWFTQRPERLDHLGVAGGTTLVCLGVVLATAG